MVNENSLINFMKKTSEKVKIEMDRIINFVVNERQVANANTVTMITSHYGQFSVFWQFFLQFQLSMSNRLTISAVGNQEIQLPW